MEIEDEFELVQVEKNADAEELITGACFEYKKKEHPEVPVEKVQIEVPDEKKEETDASERSEPAMYSAFSDLDNSSLDYHQLYLELKQENDALRAENALLHSQLRDRPFGPQNAFDANVLNVNTAPYRGYPLTSTAPIWSNGMLYTFPTGYTTYNC